MTILQLQLPPTHPLHQPPLQLQVKPPKKLLPDLTTTATTTTNNLQFREKLLYLENHLRIDSSRALAQNPSLHTAPLSSVLSVVSYLSSFQISPLDCSRIFSMYPHLLTCHPPSHLQPAISFLLGPASLPLPHLRPSLLRCPRLLVSPLRPTLYFLRRLGFSQISTQTSLLLVCDVERTLIPKLDFIQSLGFSYRETSRLVLRSPGLLTFSVDNNFRPKAQFLVEEMGRDVKEIKEFPQYFSFSLEGKIRPRHRMLVETGVKMGLAEMLKPGEAEFRERVMEMQGRCGKLWTI